MNYALLLLAGNSKRFNNQTPKQFYIMKGKPVYYYPLKALNDSPLIDQIIILTLKDKVVDVFNYTKNNKFNKVKAVISGGVSRNETVKFGLNQIKDVIKDEDIILIHDAARALLDMHTIEIAINETKKKGATTFALHSYDTLVKASSNYEVTSYLERNEIFRLQTPQTFKAKIIMNAYQNKKDTHDDTELVFLNKNKVHLLKGSERLFKITNFDDIKKLESYLK
ncbi:MAG: 2-C-methyl-D-erythritol 4-phosphate cytidylyltransferase [Bacilli bacterium]|nr:2-C-methyl-D-erythritol 4-phosphate cytidylyltransferase [Bacilli bacterium]